MHSARDRVPGCRSALLFGLLALALAWGACSAEAAPSKSLQDYVVGNYRIGGDFTLTDQHGKPAGLRDWRGKAVMMFFGYTHCPDICPLTLTQFKTVLMSLGPQTAQVQAVFVTVDPERDTRSVVGAYVGYFNTSIVGLTGSLPAIQKVATQYSAVFRKEASTSAAGYTVGHSGFIYLIDRQGKVRYLLPPDAGAPLLEEAVRALLSER